MLMFFITLFVLLIIVAAMAIGVIMGRKPISGSCGGIGAALGEDDYVCDICGGDPDKCEESGNSPADDNQTDRKLYYDASH